MNHGQVAGKFRIVEQGAIGLNSFDRFIEFEVAGRNEGKVAQVQGILCQDLGHHRARAVQVTGFALFLGQKRVGARQALEL